MLRRSGILWGVVLLAAGALSCDARAPTEPENRAPTANAGSDRTELDVDGDGSETIVLDGSRSFDRDGSIVSYAWLEDGDSIATAPSPEVSFALGVHRITLVVTDDRGGTGSDFVWIVVESPPVNRPPSALILSPADGSEFSLGLIEFRGLGSDVDEGQLVGDRLRWMADGQLLGVGDEIETFDLEAGIHRITLVATDAEGEVGRDSITISVRVSFADNVLPTFLRRCAECHGSETAEAGVRLDSYAAIVSGENRNGPLVVAGDPTQGILIPKLEAEHHDEWGWGMDLDTDAWFVDAVLTPWILDGLPNN